MLVAEGALLPKMGKRDGNIREELTMVADCWLSALGIKVIQNQGRSVMVCWKSSLDEALDQRVSELGALGQI